MYICVYIYRYIYIYIHTYIYIGTYIYIYASSAEFVRATSPSLYIYICKNVGGGRGQAEEEGMK